MEGATACFFEGPRVTARPAANCVPTGRVLGLTAVTPPAQISLPPIPTPCPHGA